MLDQESIKTLEEEIHVLEEKLAARKQTEAGMGEQTARHEKEIFRDVLQEHMEQVRGQWEQAARAEGEIKNDQNFYLPPGNAIVAKQKADELKEQEHHEQIEALVAIALTKGILEAIVVARHLGNPHLLDDFHDALVDEYYEKLLLSRELTTQ